MSNCTKCGSTDIINIHAKCKDMCWMERDGVDYGESYVDSHIGVGGGDYLEFEYCANCGQMVGNFPIKKFEKENNEHD